MSKAEERSTIGTNLRRLLNENKVKRTEVAEAIGIKYSTFCDWTRGRTSPDPYQLQKIAEYFKVSIGNLTTLPDNISNVSDSEILDFKERVAIENQKFVDDEVITSSTEWEYIPKYLIHDDDRIGFVINEDSMEPEFCFGDIVIGCRVKYLNTDNYFILDTASDDEWLPNYRVVKVEHDGNEVIISPLKLNNKFKYMPERLSEQEYMEKYKSKYRIIRHIRDYK